MAMPTMKCGCTWARFSMLCRGVQQRDGGIQGSSEPLHEGPSHILQCTAHIQNNG